MTKNQWEAFSAFREDFRKKCDAWAKFSDMLTRLSVSAAEKDTPSYPHETAVVYNRALDDITEKSEICYIVVGDNPGKDEQLAKNNRYLVGQSGKIAQSFFAKNTELGADFRRNVIILNKTPVHTAKTNHLRAVMRSDSEAAELVRESQKWLAEKTARLHMSLVGEAAAGGERIDARAPEIWLVGYSELKKNGIFSLYRDTLAATYEGTNLGAESWERVMTFQHFSMNRFAIDLKKRQSEFPKENLLEALAALGEMHRLEIFGK